MKRLLFQFISLITVLTLACPSSAYSLSVEPDPSSSQTIRINAATLEIPSEMGHIETLKDQGVESPWIILIQDAHCVRDSEEQIARLLSYLQKEYALNLVGVEGGSGRLDPTLLSTFPDAHVRNSVLNQYILQGELSGAELASIQAEGKAGFYGVEDASIYKENFNAYSQVQQNSRTLEKQFSSIEASLDKKRPGVYSKIQNEFHQKIWPLSEQSEQFPQLIQALFDFLKKGNVNLDLSAPEYVRIKLLFEALAVDSSKREEDQDRFLRSFAALFKKKQFHFLTPKEQSEFSGKHQAYLSHRLDAPSFLAAMASLAKRHGISLPLPAELEDLVKHYDLLQSMQGLEVAREIQSLQHVIEEALITGEKARELLESYRRLRLLKGLGRLSLTRDELDDYLKETASVLELLGSQKMLIQPAVEFYEAALKREQSLKNNLQALMQKKHAQQAAIISGGFHTEGLAALFAQEGFSYAIITPKISSLSGHEHYERVMEGRLSYASPDRKNPYDALMRDASVKMMGQIPDADFTKTLKSWRDELIRRLAEEKRIDEIGKYIRYLEELKPAIETLDEKEMNHAWKLFNEVFDQRLEKLKTLASEGNFDAIHVEAALFGNPVPAAAVSSALMPELALIPGHESVHIPLNPARSEMRKIKEVEEKPELTLKEKRYQKMEKYLSDPEMLAEVTKRQRLSLSNASGLDADDLLSRLYERLKNNFPNSATLRKNYKADADPKTYIFRALVNIAMTEGRKKGRHETAPLPLALPGKSEDPFDSLSRKEHLSILREAIKEAMASLPESQQEYAKRHFIEGETVKEIYEELKKTDPKVTRSSVRMILWRITQILREKLGDLLPEEVLESLLNRSHKQIFDHDKPKQKKSPRKKKIDPSQGLPNSELDFLAQIFDMKEPAEIFFQIDTTSESQDFSALKSFVVDTENIRPEDFIFVSEKTKKGKVARAGHDGAARFQQLRLLLDVSHAEMGKRLNPASPIPEGTIKTWSAGNNRVPQEVLDQLEMVVADRAPEAIRGMLRAYDMSAEEFAKEFFPEDSGASENLKKIEAGSLENRTITIDYFEKSKQAFLANSGKALERLMKDYDIVQEDLARSLGISRPTLSNGLKNGVSYEQMLRSKASIQAKVSQQLLDLRTRVNMDQETFLRFLDLPHVNNVEKLAGWETSELPPALVVRQAKEQVQKYEGDRLHGMRRYLALTQSELGKTLEVKKNTVSAWERGVHPIPPGVMSEVERLYQERLQINFTEMLEALGYVDDISVAQAFSSLKDVTITAEMIHTWRNGGQEISSEILQWLELLWRREAGRIFSERVAASGRNAKSAGVLLSHGGDFVSAEIIQNWMDGTYPVPLEVLHSSRDWPSISQQFLLSTFRSDLRGAKERNAYVNPPELQMTAPFHRYNFIPKIQEDDLKHGGYLIRSSWGQQIIIVRHHHHVVPGWREAYARGLIPAGSKLLHIDEHSDNSFSVRSLKGIVPLFPLGMRETLSEEDILSYTEKVRVAIGPNYGIATFVAAEILAGLIDSENFLWISHPPFNKYSAAKFQHFNWNPSAGTRSKLGFMNGLFKMETRQPSPRLFAALTPEIDIIDLDVDVFEKVIEEKLSYFANLFGQETQKVRRQIAVEELTEENFLKRLLSLLALEGKKESILLSRPYQNLLREYVEKYMVDLRSGKDPLSEDNKAAKQRVREIALRAFIDQTFPWLIPLLAQAKVLSIATSPGYIDQTIAVEITNGILKDLELFKKGGDILTPYSVSKHEPFTMNLPRFSNTELNNLLRNENIPFLNFSDVRSLADDFYSSEAFRAYLEESYSGGDSEILLDFIQRTNPRLLTYGKLLLAFLEGRKSSDPEMQKKGKLGIAALFSLLKGSSELPQDESYHLRREFITLMMSQQEGFPVEEWILEGFQLLLVRFDTGKKPFLDVSYQEARSELRKEDPPQILERYLLLPDETGEDLVSRLVSEFKKNRDVESLIEDLKARAQLNRKMLENKIREVSKPKAQITFRPEMNRLLENAATQEILNAALQEKATDADFRTWFRAEFGVEIPKNLFPEKGGPSEGLTRLFDLSILQHASEAEITGIQTALARFSGEGNVGLLIASQWLEKRQQFRPLMNAFPRMIYGQNGIDGPRMLRHFRRTFDASSAFSILNDSAESRLLNSQVIKGKTVLTNSQAVAGTGLTAESFLRLMENIRLSPFIWELLGKTQDGLNIRTAGSTELSAIAGFLNRLLDTEAARQALAQAA